MILRRPICCTKLVDIWQQSIHLKCQGHLSKPPKVVRLEQYIDCCQMLNMEIDLLTTTSWSILCVRTLENKYKTTLVSRFGSPAKFRELLKSSFNRIKSDEWAWTRKQLRNEHKLNVEGVTIDIVYDAVLRNDTLLSWPATSDD